MSCRRVRPEVNPDKKHSQPLPASVCRGCWHCMAGEKIWGPLGMVAGPWGRAWNSEEERRLSLLGLCFRFSRVAAMQAAIGRAAKVLFHNWKLGVLPELAYLELWAPAHCLLPPYVLGHSVLRSMIRLHKHCSQIYLSILSFLSSLGKWLICSTHFVLWLHGVIL